MHKRLGHQMGMLRQDKLIQSTLQSDSDGKFLIDLRKTPLPMQYLGSKGRISDWIINNIVHHFPSSEILFDLFAGTGIVSCSSMPQEYKLYINDVQPYSYILLKSIFEMEREGLDSLAEKVLDLKNDKKILAGNRSGASKLLKIERELFKKARTNKLDWIEYKNFCDNTPLVDSKNEIDALRKKFAWDLFIKYYGNTYFGIEQCLALDTIRQFANELDEIQKNHIIAAAISVMTYAVSSTTHLAQYLKANNKVSTQSIIDKRQFDIIKAVSNRLMNLFYYPLPTKKATVMNLNYIEALNNTKLDEKWVVYIDPPYFKEHYSRYYHLLDTFYLYDYPYLTYNPRLEKITIGRYRVDRFVSKFGLRGKVENAFSELFSLCYKTGAKIVLSYADTSLVTSKRILDIAKEVGYNINFKQKKLMHSGQGQPRHKIVTEYLYFFERGNDFENSN